MKLINYSFLPKKQQQIEKGIILNENDILHILVNKKFQTEIVVKVHNSRLEICSKEEFKELTKKKKEF